MTVSSASPVPEMLGVVTPCSVVAVCSTVGCSRQAGNDGHRYSRPRVEIGDVEGGVQSAVVLCSKPLLQSGKHAAVIIRHSVDDSCAAR